MEQTFLNNRVKVKVGDITRENVDAVVMRQIQLYSAAAASTARFIAWAEIKF
jgi:hypothetical protein